MAPGSINLCTVVLLLLPLLASPSFSSEPTGPHTVVHDGRETIQLPNDAIDGVVWAVQLSDLHVSSYYPDRAASLRTLMGPLLAIIHPALVLITGDLTDAKSKDRTSRRQDVTEWLEYRHTITKVIEESGLPSYAFYDLRGNHDKFGVPEVGGHLDYFSKYSVNSLRNRSKTVQSVTLMNRDWKHLFLGVDMSMEIGLRGPCNLFGHPTDEQLTVVDQELSQWDSHASGKVTKLVFGHFPMSFTASTASRNRLEPLLAKHAVSAYVCGHLHKNFGSNLIKHHVHRLAESEDGEFWEWEMGDWRMCRMMRIIVIDQGHTSYVDFDFSSLNASNSESKDWLPTLVVPTFPLDSEKMKRIRSQPFSAQGQDTVRALIISPRPIVSVFVKFYMEYGGGLVFIEESEMHVLSKAGRTVYMYVSKWNTTKYADDKGYMLQISVLDSAGIETDSSFRPFSVSRRVRVVKNTWREFFVIGFVWEHAFTTLMWFVFTCLLASLILPKIIFHSLVRRGVYNRWVFSLFKDGTRKLDPRKKVEMFLWFFVQGSANTIWWGQLLVLLWLIFLPWLWGQALAEGYPLGFMSLWGWTVHMDEKMPQISGLGWPDLMLVVLPFMFLVIVPLYLLIFALSAEASLRQLYTVDVPTNYKKNETNSETDSTNYKKNEKNSETDSETKALLSREANAKKEKDQHVSSGNNNSLSEDQKLTYLKWSRILLVLLCLLVSFTHIGQVCAIAGAYGTMSVFASPGFAWPVPVLLVAAMVNSSSCKRTK